jgi:diguanylate cyclase (GGDEF)-like protein
MKPAPTPESPGPAPKLSPKENGLGFSPAYAPARPTRMQEMVRQWIMLIPLATAVVGSAAIQSLPVDQYAEILPPMFFAGALIVTAAMLHQRHLLTHNFALTDELQAAHERLDTLHHLALELNASLNVAQVAQTVLNHTLQLVDAQSGALWLRTEILPPPEVEALLHINSPSGPALRALSGEAVVEKPWQLFAARGFSGFGSEKDRQTLCAWQNHLQHVQESVAGGVEVLPNGGPVWVPVMWKGQMAGAIFVQAARRELSAESRILLGDIALVAGPSLQNAMLFQAASERAEIDGLTLLYNHRAIQERLQQEVARVHRAHSIHGNTSFAIAVMDITDFKLFNDTYGHAVGDQVLRSVSECLKKTFRASDIVGRFGGDEFLALLPDTPGSGSEVLCGRAVSSIAAQPFIAPDGSPISIGLTCGVASFPEDGTTPAELLKAADERLYAAKRRGELIVEENGGAPVAEVLTLRPDWSSIGLLDTLISTIDGKDHYTRAQCERVWRYAIMTAHQMKLGPDMMQATHLGALVQDVGKIVVPDAILRKPGRLTAEEFRIMQQHTIFGAMIVRDLPQLEIILGGVRHHHECWNGSGYPDQIADDEIPLLARILAVADSFAAMTTPRPYRRAFTEKQAMDEIEQGKGKQYDPVVVDAFRGALKVMSNDSAAFQQVLLQSGVAHLCRLEASGADDSSDFMNGRRNGDHQPVRQNN